ncbi:MAG: PrgI family protein [Desulfotomaculales bacterium]
MRVYSLPPEIEDAHEKFLGPLGFRQFLYAVAGFVLGCFLAALPLPVLGRIIVFFLGSGAGIVLALSRPAGMRCDVYLLRLWMWRRSKTEYYLERTKRA